MINRTIQQFYTPNPTPITDCLLWQYNNAPVINSLIDQKSNWYEAWDEEFWIQWINNVFNLTTANDFGLSVWSIILNLPLFINTPNPNITDIWGFNAYTSNPTLENTYTNFSYGNFSNYGSSYVLTTEEQRFALRLKYLDLISRGSVPQFNYNMNWLMLSSLQKGLFLGSAIANPTMLTGTIVSGSNIIMGLSSTVGLAELMTVSGTDIPAGTIISSIPSSTSVIISNNATGDATEFIGFGFPTAWELEEFDMTVMFQFNFYLSSNLQRVIRNFNLLPVCSGVLATYQYWNGSSYVDF